MVRVHGYNAEKNSKGFLDVYLKAIFLGAIGVVVFISLLLGAGFMVRLFIKYWAWTIGLIGFLIILKKFILDRGRKSISH